jgi:hypothetical protein
MTTRALLLALGLLALLAVPAAAQDAGEVAAALSRTGAYVEEGADTDPEALADAAGRAAESGNRFGFVVLSEPADVGTDFFADEVLDRWGVAGTVVVLDQEEVFASSEAYGSAAIDGALDAALDLFRDDPVAGFATFAATLTGTVPSAPATAAPVTPTSSGGGFPWALVVVLIVIGGVVFLILRSRRQSRRRAAAELEEARAEIREQLTTLGGQIFDLESAVTLSPDPTVKTRYAEATATFQAAREELEQAADHVALAALADRVDRARWQLEAVAATLDGRPAPPEPTAEAPVACFFDPTHRAATEEATVRTAAGTAEVRVCADCADRLRAGERPEPRQIPVNGRPVSAPQAPRSHGGGGFNWVTGAIEVLAKGMATGASYEMGRGATRRRTPVRRPTASRSTGITMPPLAKPGSTPTRSTPTRSIPPPSTPTRSTPPPPTTRGRGGRKLGGGSTGGSSGRGRGRRKL